MSIKSVARLAFVAIIAVQSSAGLAQSSLSDIFSEAGNAMRDNNYAKACTLYERAVQLDHSSSTKRLAAQAWVSYAHTQSGSRAASCYQRAYSLDPTNSQAKAGYESGMQSVTGASSAMSRTTQNYGNAAAVNSGAMGSGSPYATMNRVTNSRSAVGSRTSYASSTTNDSSASGPAPDARSYFLAQNKDPRWNRDAMVNDANCAPTCLAMACKRFSLYPDGVNAQSDAQHLILSSRLQMTGTLIETTGTTAVQFMQGARRIGFKSNFVNTINDVETAVDHGELCLIGGCPWMERSYGPRYKSSHYPVFHNGHCILVVGKQGGYYTVNDPLYFDGPINVSSSELEAFLAFHRSNPKGIAVCR